MLVVVIGVKAVRVAVVVKAERVVGVGVTTVRVAVEVEVVVVGVTAVHGSGGASQGSVGEGGDGWRRRC